MLDLVPVHRDQTTAHAVAASMALARTADSLGYTRYWYAEHHNMPSVASTSPSVMVGLAAASTQRIRVGSGGVMLPNHAPFIVAEQFALLEAAAPGRIDLGIGRAPGSDQVISLLLHQSGTTSDVEGFPTHIETILALLGHDGAQFNIGGGRTYEVRATPSAQGRPEVWLLGSSDYSATLAARLGLPYVFANHFSGDGIDGALDIYRRNFVPSGFLDAPRTFLTVNAVVADTAEEAEARAMPNLIQLSRLRSGKSLAALGLVDDTDTTELDAMQLQIIDTMRPRWVIGDAASAADRLRELAARHAVDEIMVSVGAGRRFDEALDRSAARQRTLELLAEQLL